MDHSDLSPEALARLAFTDDLTGLYNHRFFKQYLSKEVDWNAPPPTVHSLLMIDVDKFKDVNDTHGHLAGDRALRTVAQVIKDNARGADIVIRYAGDEFCVILPQTQKEDAATVAEKMRATMEQSPLRLGDGTEAKKVSISISIGVAAFPEDGSSAEQLMEAADKALYCSKHKGRNQVAVAGRMDSAIVSDHDALKTFPCARFIGRQRELDAVDEAICAVEQGANLLLLVRGERGIGKTRLLSEVARTRTHVASLLERCSEAEQAVPFKPLLTLLELHLKRDPQELDRLAGRLLAEQVAVLAQDIPALNAVRPKGVDIEEYTPEQARRYRFEGIVNLLWVFSQVRPVLVLLDEFQNADEGTVEVMETLAGLPRGRVLFMGALMSGEDREQKASGSPLGKALAALEQTDKIRTLDLGSLSPRAITEMINTLLPDRPLSPHLDEALIATGKGNPLYVEEALKSLIDTKAVRRAGRSWIIGDVKPGDLLPSVEAAIQHDLGTLDRETAKILAEAAVIGPNFSLDLLKDVAGVNEGEALEIVERAQRKRLIDGAGNQEEYRFVSTRVQEITYESTDAQFRKDAHARVGDAEEARAKDNPEQAAATLEHHFRRAGQIEKANRYREMVAQRALTYFQPDEAATYRSNIRHPIPEATEPVPEDCQPICANVMRGLCKLVKMVRMYPPGSQLITQAAEALDHSLVEILARIPAFTFSVPKDALLLNTALVDPATWGDVVRDLRQLLRDHYVQSLTFTNSTDAHEVEAVVNGLSLEFDPTTAGADYWGRYCDEQGIDDIGILQRAFEVAEPETGAAAPDLKDLEDEPLDDASLAIMKDVLRYLCATVSNLRLYPEGSQLIAVARDLLHQSLTALFARIPIFTLSEVENTLLINGVVASPKTFGTAIGEFTRITREHHIPSLSVIRGVTPPEMAKVLKALSEPARGEEEAPGYWGPCLEGIGITHVAVGLKVYGITGGAKGPTPEEAQAEPLTPGQEAVQRATAWLRADGEALLAPDVQRVFVATLETLLLDQRNDLVEPLLDRCAKNLVHAAAQVRTHAVDAHLALFEKAPRTVTDLLVPRTLPSLVEALRAETDAPTFARTLDLVACLLRGLLADSRYGDARVLVWAVGRERAEPDVATPELGRIVENGLKQILDGDVGDHLLSALTNGDEAAQAQVAQVLAGFGAVALRRLVAAVRDTPALPIRKHLALVLHESAEAALAALSRELGPGTSSERYLRILEVLDLVSPAIEAQTLAALHHPDDKVQREARALLKRLPKERSINLLSDLVMERDPRMLRAGVELIGELHCDEMADVLLKILEVSKDESLLSDTCFAAAKLGDERFVPVLGRIIGRTGFLGWGAASDEVRTAATWALGGFPVPAARAILEKAAATDKSPSVRSAAKMGLRQP